ncbi:MAG: glycoside hydrolase family 28 protein, partial [Melioribacteraceae bacterium]|nr:glycoside hydrolase family 28 protein [Melioribacteraceae bacterium]
ERNFPPIVRNVFLDGLESKKSKYAFYLDGLEQSKIKNIFITNSNLNGVEKNSIIDNVENFNTEKLFINGDPFSAK